MTNKLRWICAGLFAILLLPLLVPSVTFAAPPRQEDDLKAKANALYDEGIAFFNQADYQGALAKFEEALLLFQEAGDREGEAKTLHILGRAYLSLAQFQEALDYFQQTLTIRQEINDRMGEGETLNIMGLLYFNVGRYQEAMDYSQQALAVRQELGDRAGEGSTLNNIGAIYQRVGYYTEALDYFQQALPIQQETGDRNAEGRTLTNIGAVYESLGQYSQALDYYQQALPIQQETGDRLGEGTTLNNIGAVYQDTGQYPQALDYYQQALVIRQEVGDRVGHEATLNNIGSVYQGMGQYPEALDYLQQSLTIAQEIGDRPGEGIMHTNIGSVYHKLGRYSQALDYYQQALVILQEVGDREGEAANINNTGEVYRSLGQYSQALDYYQQALDLAQEIGDRAGEGIAFNNIGLAFRGLGQDSQALDYYRQSLTISQEIGDRAAEATALNNIGGSYRSLKQYAQALDHHQQALAIRQEIGDRAGEGAALSNLGWVYEEWGDSAQAISYYQQAVENIESIQGYLKVEELKAAFAAERSGTYEHLINLLWQEGRSQEAFNFAERARARAFLDQLAGGIIDFRTGIDADLLGREQELRNEITALRNQLLTLRNRPESDWDTATITALQADLTGHEADYSQLLTEIKLQSPEVAGLVSMDVASLADIQSRLDANTTLVEYIVTEDRTLAFIITHDSFETVAVDVNWENLSQTIDGFRDFGSLDDPHPVSLKQLYTWLIAPLKDRLTKPVLGIIPHGVLHYLPFAALTDGTRYLDEDYILFTLPSASALRFIQEKRKPTSNTILALGNPTITEPGLAPLEFAQREVEHIADLFGATPLLGDLATESALRSQAGDAGIVHIAAHGQYNSFNPLFSVVYLADDKEEDGRLEVNEIYGLNLTKSTDLVVLSACESQVGQVSAGDEVIGMTRAFLYAGTPTVIASLWKVDDQATTFLMERFYAHLQEGVGKAQALQQAQSEARAQYHHPYYWAAFVLTGDPGITVKEDSGKSFLANNRAVWIIGSVVVLLLVVGTAIIIAVRRKGSRP